MFHPRADYTLYQICFTPEQIILYNYNISQPRADRRQEASLPLLPVRGHPLQVCVPLMMTTMLMLMTMTMMTSTAGQWSRARTPPPWRRPTAPRWQRPAISPSSCQVWCITYVGGLNIVNERGLARLIWFIKGSGNRTKLDFTMGLGSRLPNPGCNTSLR